MRKFTLVLGLSIVLTISVGAQSGLYLGAGTSFFIGSGNVVSVDGLVLEPSGAFTITGSNSLLRNTSLTHSSLNSHISRVFNLANTVNGFSGNITIYYNDAELNGISEASLTLNNHNGSSWAAFSSGVTRDGTANYVRTTALSSVNLNELTLASVLAPLPLNWGPVTAYRKEKVAYVDWLTYNEINTAYFEVESSTADRTWSRVGNPVTAFNSGGDHSYSLTDYTVTGAKTFYRIKQVDIDNRFTYSPIVSVNESNGLGVIDVYPNPVQSLLTVRSQVCSVVFIELYGVDGKLVRSEGFTSNICQIDLAARPAGIYLLRAILSDGSSVTHRVIKK